MHRAIQWIDRLRFQIIEQESCNENGTAGKDKYKMCKKYDLSKYS